MSGRDRVGPAGRAGRARISGSRRRRCGSACGRRRPIGALQAGAAELRRSGRRSSRRASEVFELRRANEILKAASVFFATRARRRPDRGERVHRRHRDRFGVEPICRTLGVSASAYYQRATGERSARGVEDERLIAGIREVHRGELRVLRATGGCGTRCSARASRSAATTVARLMRAGGRPGRQAARQAVADHDRRS